MQKSFILYHKNKRSNKCHICFNPDDKKIVRVMSEDCGVVLLKPVKIRSTISLKY